MSEIIKQAPERAQIVVIEDNPADVLLIQKSLADNGVLHDLTHFEDGEEALHALCPQTGTPRVTPDVIVLDLNLPRSEGIDVLRKLRQMPRFADTPVAILTSSESPADQQRSSRIGADRYILKPAMLDEFIARVGGGIKELLGSRGKGPSRAAPNPNDSESIPALRDVS
jgi:CheY-like chemotaxis protein